MFTQKIHIEMHTHYILNKVKVQMCAFNGHTPMCTLAAHTSEGDREGSTEGAQRDTMVGGYH